MPIYAYKCESCGYVKDVLQKMSDAPLEICPHCATTSFKKQVTAAGFQLKGSGWYATDFKGKGASAPTTTDGPDSVTKAAPAEESATSAKAAAAPVTPTAPPATNT